MCIINEDVQFASSLGLYHLALGMLLAYCTTVGGSSHKVLVPFVIHNFMGAVGLIMSTPSKLSQLFAKMHAA